jgi:F0F1-type ATP synthase epsilon subunit
VSILSDTAELSEDIDVERAKAGDGAPPARAQAGARRGVLTEAVSGKSRAAARLTAAGESFTS